MNNLKKYAMIGTFALAMACGCSKEPPECMYPESSVYERKMPEAEGYDVRVMDIVGTRQRIMIGKSLGKDYGFSEVVNAELYDPNLPTDGYRKYCESRVCQITLSGVERGSKLEELASPKKIMEIYDYMYRKHHKSH